METTGQRIKRARLNAGLTQRQLAEKLGISAQGIAQWENNLRNPKAETLRRIAKAIGCPIGELTGHQLDPDIEQIISDASRAESLMPDWKKLLKASRSIAYPGLSDTEIDALEAEAQREQLLFFFDRLNQTGRQEALKRMFEMVRIAEYQAPPTPAPQDGGEEDALDAQKDE